MSENSTESTTEQSATTQETGKPDTGGPDLTAELEKWKALARKHEGTAKANADAAKRLAEIEAANASDLEKAVKAARDEGRAEVQTAANTRLITAEARALAAEMQFRKPAHAVRLIDLAEVTVDDAGEVDAAAVRKLLDDLAKDDPLLLAVPDDGRPKGDVDQGVRQRATSTNPRQADLDQIEADLSVSRRK
jgi:hypothetical protein